MRTLYEPGTLRKMIEGIFNVPGVKDRFRARGIVFLGDVKKPVPAKRSGSGASSPRTFLTSRRGNKTFGDVEIKRKTLGVG